MRTLIAHSAILIFLLLASSTITLAQTGEFAGQVPGPIVHEGWRLQDQFQNARSKTSIRSVARTAGSNDGLQSARPAASVTFAKTTKGGR